MYENGCIQTVTKDFSTRGEQELSISRTFARLYGLDYETARWSNQSFSCSSDSLVTSCVWNSNETVAVVSKISNSCVGQAVIVIIIVVFVKCKQWHKSSANNKEFLSETKHALVVSWFAIKGLISKRFLKGKNVTICILGWLRLEYAYSLFSLYLSVAFLSNTNFYKLLFEFLLRLALRDR